MRTTLPSGRQQRHSAAGAVGCKAAQPPSTKAKQSGSNGGACAPATAAQSSQPPAPPPAPSASASIASAVRGSLSVASLKSLAGMASGRRQQCRYCLCTDEADRLCKSRCQCAGTMSYVHDRCLVESRRRNAKLPWGNCEICHWPFEPRLPRLKNRRSQVTRCITVATVGSVLLVAAVVLLLADYVNEKMLTEKNAAEAGRLSGLRTGGTGGARQQQQQRKHIAGIAANPHRLFPAAAAAKPTERSLSRLLSGHGELAAEKRLVAKVFVLAVASAALAACSWTYARCRRRHGCIELQAGIVASERLHDRQPHVAFRDAEGSGNEWQQRRSTSVTVAEVDGTAPPPAQL